MQAILRLSEEGLVEILPRKGTFVIDVGEERIRQLFDACEAVEGYSARLAAQRRTDADLAHAEQILTEWKTAEQTLAYGPNPLGAVSVLLEADSRFHCYIVELSGNPYLVSTYQKLDAQVWAFVPSPPVAALRTTPRDRRHGA